MTGARIAYVDTRYPAISHAFVLREVEALRARGVDVHTFAIHRSRPGDRLAEADQRAAETTYAVRPITPWRLLGEHVAGFWTSPRAYLRTLGFALRRPGGKRTKSAFWFAEAVPIWRRCRKAQITHVHAHFASPSTDVALLVARLGGWTFSFTTHGTDMLSDDKRRLADKVRQADLCVCVSDFGRSQLLALVEPEHWDRIGIVRCGLDHGRFMPNGNGHWHAERPLRLLTVGRTHRVKGQALLIDAVAELRARGVAVEATIVGDGDLLEPLRAHAEERGVADVVNLPGAVDQDRIRAVYADADVFVLPSFSEGIPVVLMEAMAMRLPVVATRIMGVPELVADGRTGLLVTPGRVDELADAIERLAGDPALRTLLGHAGREKVLADHDVDRSAETLTALLDPIVAAP